MDLAKMQGLMQGIKDIREEKNAMSPEEANALNRQGLEEYNAQNYGKAADLFLEAAENGDAWGMYNVGTAYRDGEGISQNMEEAFYWIKKAAQEGIVDAMFDTGRMYYRGEGTAPDVAQTFAWCKKAAEEGNVGAMNWVGEFYRDGEGVVQNYIEALRWFERSAHGGNMYAAFNAAYMYDKGNGIDQNKTKAFYWYKVAAEAGHVTAMNNLACKYDDGEGTSQNYELAGYWYVKAVENDTENSETIKNNLEIFADKHPGMTVRLDNGRVYTFHTSIAKSNDGCFITTAVCGSFGKPDDCYELMSFRKFRDRWLVKEADGKSLIAEYYEVAPKIVSRINEMTNAKEIYRSIWDNYLKPCLDYIEQGSFAKCKELYVRMVRELKEKY